MRIAAPSELRLASVGGMVSPSDENKRVAVVCDFLEERWPSMDLVGDMLFEQLSRHHSKEFATIQVRPAMRRRFSRLPIGQSKSAHTGDRLLNRMFDYPRTLRRIASQFDVVHIVDHSYAHLALEFAPERTIVTCHDLNTFRCLLEPDKEPRSRWFNAIARRILNGMNNCARVICVSSTVRDEILRYRLLPDDRLRVVHNGFHPSCSHLPDLATDSIAAHLLGEDLEQRDIYLLHVGSTVARKRIDRLLHIFSHVRKRLPSAHLVRVGGPFTPEQEALAQRLGVLGAIHVMPFLEREILSAIYRRAAVVLQPSDAEGFGLPIVEALACGRAVIASDLPVFREVGASAVVYCPLDDIAAWSDAVIEQVEKPRSSPNAFEESRLLALNRAAQFSWTAAIEKIAAVYREVVND
jgi:glycosyltransferase involved in cell wall biosynthesis